MSKHIVVIGAVALGPKAACRLKRLIPDAKVTMVDKSDVISYGGCGIPYYVSGDVSDSNELLSTSFHMLRDIPFFKDVKGVDVLTKTEALAIDRENKTVRLRDLDSGEERDLDYDHIVLATGAAPRRLPIPGADLPGVHYVAGLRDAESIRMAVTKGRVERAVIVGAGFIGLEMAEALADMWDVKTSVVEIAGQVLPGLVGPALAEMAQKHLRDKGITLHLNATVDKIEGEDGVTGVVIGGERLEADMVIIGAGVIPNTGLAKDAGLAVSSRGGVEVDDRMRTSDPDIYAGGDCVEIKNMITGKPFYLPLGSMANRQGRIIGANLAGGDSRFEGAVGSFCVKIFDKCAAGAGMSLETAQKNGFNAASALILMFDRAHFYPEKQLMALELVVEKETRRILGIQGFGGAGDAVVGRVNAVAGLLSHKAVIEDICTLELAYSPPFTAAMDILNAVANMADNVLAGRNVGVGPNAFMEMWEERDSGKYFFLDCREEADAKPFLERFPEYWNNIPQGLVATRLDEIPKDRRVVLICNTGGRSYEAQITLAHAGYENVINVHGGMGMINMCGFEL